jgi:hypothetical protein
VNRRRTVGAVLTLALVLQACSSVEAPRSQPLSSSPAATPTTTSPSATRTIQTANPEDLAKVADTAALMKNAIYRSGAVPKVVCRLPTGRLGTSAELLGYGKAFVACLNRSWAPVVGRGEGYFEPPVLYAVKQGASTKCGPFNESAFYCSANRAIYFDWMLYAEKERSQRRSRQIAMIFVLAHEYGHHVQELTGIMAAYDKRYYSNSPVAEENLQRLELQATCFGAAFQGANRATLDLYGERLSDLRWMQGESASDDGKPKYYLAWARAAFSTRSAASCNTWAAPAKKVTW